MTHPELRTPRLILRPFSFHDIAGIEALAGDPEVAAGSVLIPHPYPPGLAQRWIASHDSAWRAGEALILAIDDVDGKLIGSISVVLDEQREAGRLISRGCLGYWLGRPYWGMGLMTEAVTAMIDFCFQELGLDRIEALHHTANPASGAVMRKCGLSYRGSDEQPLPDGRFLSLLRYRLDASTWQAGR